MKLSAVAMIGVIERAKSMIFHLPSDVIQTRIMSSHESKVETLYAYGATSPHNMMEIQIDEHDPNVKVNAACWSMWH